VPVVVELSDRDELVEDAELVAVKEEIGVADVEIEIEAEVDKGMVGVAVLDVGIEAEVD
jgi:hypothetical protein